MVMFAYYLHLLLLITHLPLISIPICHISFEQNTHPHAYRILHHNTRYHHHETKENFFAYSSAQLQHYFDCNHYSEKDILSQNVLYMFDEFVQLAKTYLGYEQSVTTLHHKLAKLSWFHKTYHWLVHGSYCPTLFKRVQRLYKEVKQYQQLTNTPAKSFAHLYNINLMALLPSQKPIASYNIYKDYIDILEQAYSIPVHNVVIRDCIGKASHIGLEANKHGHTKQASQLADFCHTIIDCTKAFGEGIYLGTVNTIEAITHPIETIKNSIVGIGVITHALSKLVSIPTECAFLYATDTDHYYIRKNEVINQLNMIISSTFNYLHTAHTRDIIKQGASFITKGFYLTKIFSFTHNVAKNLYPIAQNYFEYVTKKEPMACLSNNAIIKINALSKDAIDKQISHLSKYETQLAIENTATLQLEHPLYIKNAIVHTVSETPKPTVQYLQPLCRGNTGRTVPKNFHEKLVMEEIIANPYLGDILPMRKGMTDPRWNQNDGWIKMYWRNQNIEVHYVVQKKDNTIVAIDDFKFKDQIVH